jgi:hypothetical protein
MCSLRGHHGAKSADVHGNLIGRDIGANTIMAPRTLSGPYEAQPSSPSSAGLGTVGNGATNVHQASSAQFAERTLGPGSDPNLFDSVLSVSAALMAVDLTKEGRRGL